MNIKQKIIIKIINTFKKLIDNRFFKKYIYLSFKSDKFILCGNKEYFVVNSSDHAIGKELFIKSEFGFENMTKAFNILKQNYKTISNYTLLDIGANIGSISIPSVKRKFLKEAIAVEPNPESYRLLCSNIFLNNLNNSVIPKQICLGEKKSKVFLILSSKNHGDNRISYSRNKNKNSIKLSSVTLDFFTQSYNKKFIIKVDAQGSESLILKHGQKTLSRKPPLILEFDKNIMKEGDFLKIVECLTKSKYNSIYDLGLIKPFKIKFSEKNIFLIWNNLSKNSITDLLFI